MDRICPKQKETAGKDPRNGHVHMISVSRLVCQIKARFRGLSGDFIFLDKTVMNRLA
jgi:hypothetical protein